MRKMHPPHIVNLACFALCLGGTAMAQEGVRPVRSLRFRGESVAEAQAWQAQSRAKLFALMMGGAKPTYPSQDPRLLRRETSADDSIVLEELTVRSLPDREVHVWIGLPKREPRTRLPGILALHGHGGTGEQIVRGESLYGYGKALIERGYVVATLDLGQHELQHKDWFLMGERVWDALACLDALAHRPEVDPDRLGAVGLSLGGESVMYVAALDERIKVAVSSGWLTTVANMKNGHCPCWAFPGLEENFDFSDIFSCVAPRVLVCQVGLQERAPGGFPVEVARSAFKEIQSAYRVFGAEDRCLLDVHEGGHVLDEKAPFERLDEALR